jgi:AcrR family transcriptional regulator
MQTRSELTQKQIKAAAIELFSHSGYDAASVADICEKAGVSKGAFYHHFPSKQSLFLEIMQDWLSGIDQLLFKNGDITESVPQRIRNMGNLMGVIFRAAKGQLPMFMEFMVQASRDQTVWEAVISPYRTYQHSFTAMIEKGKKEGTIALHADADEVARALMSLAIGILLQGVVDPDAADWKKATISGVDLILDGITRGEP